MVYFPASKIIMPMGFVGGTLGAGEVVVILLVLLLLFGARRLPELARSMGRAVEEFRRAARDLSRDVMLEDTPPPESPPPPSPPPTSREENLDPCNE